MASNYSEADWKEAFCLCDTDGDGKIDTKDVGLLMRASGLNPSNSEIDMVILEYIKSGHSTITYSDFLALMTKKSLHYESEEQVREAFKLFDRNSQGWHVVSTLGEKMNEEEVDNMLKDADPNNTGRIEYSQFVNMLLNKR